jgi:hypothetical protein
MAALTWPLLMLACGGDAKGPAAPSPSAEGSAQSSPTARATGLPGALAGRWEIVRFESKATVPPEAQAIFAQMFDTLRLELRPDGTASVTVGKTTTPASWSVEGSAESFTFRMRDGLLDGAKCRVTGDREWEAFEASGSWPGTSRLRRLD